MSIARLDQVLMENYAHHPAMSALSPLALGDICTYKDGILDRRGSLAALAGLSLTEIVSNTTHSEWFFSSQGDIDLQSKMAAGTAPIVSWIARGRAGIGLKLKSDDAFIFRAQGLNLLSLPEQQLTERQLLDYYDAHTADWDRNWVVVTSLAIANQAFILHSNNKDTLVELSSEAELAVAPIKISDLSADFRIAMSSKSVGFHAARQAIVAWQGVRIRDRFFSRPRSVRAGPSSPEMTFEAVYEVC